MGERTYTPEQYNQMAIAARAERARGSNYERWGCLKQVFMGALILAGTSGIFYALNILAHS